MQKITAILALLAILPVAAHAQSGVQITSEGMGNIVHVDQTAAINAKVMIEQIGDAGRSAIVQGGSGHSAILRLRGSDNDMRSTQLGEGSNSLHVAVSGDANNSQNFQHGFAGGSNAMALDQAGNGNSATLSQLAYAGHNEMILRQYGNDNDAVLRQNGDGNQLALTQNGDGNSAQLSQNGDGLGLTINQAGGAAIVITQTTP